MSSDGIIYKVKDGEWVGSIAEKHRRYDWKSIWEHPNNLELRKLRGSPWTLGEGDELFIPPLKTKSISLETGKKYSFVLKKNRETFRYKLVDDDNNPISDEAYKLDIFTDYKCVEFEQANEKTDKDGMIVELIPIDVTNGILSFPDIKYNIKLKFGFLSPLNSNNEKERIKAVQQRLKALGYDPGPIDGIEGSLTRAAVVQFQLSCKNDQSEGDASSDDAGPVDGKIGPKTIEAITKRFGN